MPIISFTSDFGHVDPYVGTVKAVLLGICPAAAIVDVSHGVEPGNIRQTVFLTAQAWPYFPTATVHLVVVDPGVGTERGAVAVRTPLGFVVGPDNGCLSAALPDASREAAVPVASDPQELGDSGASALPVQVPQGYEVRQIESQRLPAHPPSATFHGRDVFGPIAAHLAGGMPFADVGPNVDRLLVFPPIKARVDATGAHGVVVHVDRFGNLITSIRAVDLPAGANSTTVRGLEVPLVRTYGDGSGLVALLGSSGYLEVACVNGSAAAMLDAGIALPVTVPSG